MKKLLFISHLYPRSYDPLYGMVVHRQAYELKKLGIEVKVISPILSIPKTLEIFKKEWRDYNSVPSTRMVEDVMVYHPRSNPIISKYYPHKSGSNLFRRTEHLIEKIYKEYPFTHIHAQTALTNGLLALQIAKKYHVPLITTVNATDIDQLIYRNKKCRKVMKNVLSQSDAVLTPSPIIQEKVRNRLGIDSTYIGRGIYLNELQFEKSAVNVYKDYFVILSVSRLLPTKGIDLNMKAISLIKNKVNVPIKYLIIGEGPQKEELKQLAKDLDILEEDEFLGFTKKREVMEYMSFCDLFSLPSWQETFGLVYIEAMGHGKAVIGTRGHGIDGVVKHRENGLLVKEKDVIHLSELMMFSITNKKEMIEMGKKAKNTVLQNYTWEKIALKNRDIYEKVSQKNRL